jgi:hypothetical protein
VDFHGKQQLSSFLNVINEFFSVIISIHDQIIVCSFHLRSEECRSLRKIKRGQTRWRMMMSPMNGEQQECRDVFHAAETMTLMTVLATQGQTNLQYRLRR